MSTSAELFTRAQKSIPGGVNSPVRAFKSVGGTPVFFERGEGAYVYSADDDKYIDYVGSWGPLILGHAHPRVLQAVTESVSHGLGFGASTKIEIDMAELVCSIIPSIEMVRMVSSGTEATMSAIRLARGFTGRDKFIKFEGCYHGHSDALLVQAGSGALTLGIPNSPGVPASFTEHTLVARYNDLAQVKELFTKYFDQIAAIIVEPIAGNMNCIPPAPGFLQGLREVCNENRSVLIFDEVMTGFRVALGGAQAHYDVKPDLTALGKIIGGGLPVGAFGGKRAIMEHLAPLGPVYQAGTLSGNPVAMAAGFATLSEINHAKFHPKLNQMTEKLCAGLKERASSAGIPFTTNQVGSMFGLFFSEEENISNYKQVQACNTERFNQFFHHMLDNDVYLAPSSFEASFVSAAHTDTEINLTLDAAEKAFTQL